MTVMSDLAPKEWFNGVACPYPDPATPGSVVGVDLPRPASTILLYPEATGIIMVQSFYNARPQAINVDKLAKTYWHLYYIRKVLSEGTTCDPSTFELGFG